jgi:hypothetical protein
VTVDAVVEKICNLLTNSAKSTFGTYTKAKNIRNDTSKSKPWFDDECRQARKQFRCSKRKLKRNRGFLFWFLPQSDFPGLKF